jgi:hypothetical protein
MKQNNTAAILEILKKNYPEASCALRHENPLELLLATILSAQCTDERVNKTTPALFAKYPTAKALGEADALTEADAFGEADGLTDPFGVALGLAETSALAEAEGDGSMLGSIDGIIVAIGDGLTVIVV